MLAEEGLSVSLFLKRGQGGGREKEKKKGGEEKRKQPHSQTMIYEKSLPSAVKRVSR